MISAPYVKEVILDRLEQREDLDDVEKLFGPPTDRQDIRGNALEYEQFIGWMPFPDGAFTVEEMCGADKLELDENYELTVIVQVKARDTDGTHKVVQKRAAEIMYEVTRVLQDPSLGDEVTMDGKVTRVEVTPGDAVVFTGTLANRSGGTKMPVCRYEVGLDVSAHIPGTEETFT